MKKKKYINNQTHHWRWQFLRLDKKYQVIFDSFNERIQTARSKKEKQAWIDEAKKELFEEFGISDLQDYRSKDLATGIRIEGEDPPAQRGTLEHIFEGRLNKNQSVNGPFVIEKREGPVLFEKYVSVVINYDFNLEDVIADVTEIYKRTRIPRKRSLGVKRIKKLNKSNIAHLRKCLKVFELKKKNQKWTVIGAKVFPKQNVTSRTENVRQLYRKACQLIEGSYRQIVI